MGRVSIQRSALKKQLASKLELVGENEPEYRLALAKDGYVLVRCELAVFKPEA